MTECVKGEGGVNGMVSVRYVSVSKCGNESMKCCGVNECVRV